MSFFSSLVDAVGSLFDSPNADPYTPAADPSKPSPTTNALDFSIGSQDFNGFEILKNVGALAAPYITAKVLEQPKVKYPKVPDSVKNDPRVQSLIGPYGGYTNAPEAQELSPFQLAFPTIMQNLFYDQPKTAVDTTGDITEAAINGQLTPRGLYTEQPPLDTNPQAVDMDLKIDPSRFAMQNMSRFDPDVQASAKQYGVDPALLKATLTQESQGNSRAVGKLLKNGERAYGMGQILPSTASELLGRKVAPRELLDPALNINLTAKYLSQLNKRYDNDYDKVISAYNAGMGNVDSGKAFKFPETRHYLRKVKGYRNSYLRSAGGFSN